MPLVDKAADSHALFHAGSNLPFANLGTDGFNQLIVNVFMNKQSRTCPTHLPSVHENPKTNGFRCITKVGVREDDVGAFAPQLQGDGGQLFAGFGHDGLTRWHASGQHHTVHAAVAGERIACQRPRTGQNLQNAARQTGVALIDGLPPR